MTTTNHKGELMKITRREEVRLRDWVGNEIVLTKTPVEGWRALVIDTYDSKEIEPQTFKTKRAAERWAKSKLADLQRKQGLKEK